MIVKGKIEAGGCVGMPLMFNPDDRWMAGEGLQLETSLLEADSDGLVDLVVCNPEGMTKMVRDAGSVGMVEIVDEGFGRVGRGSTSGPCEFRQR